MHECNETTHRADRSSKGHQSYRAAEETKTDSCYRTIFVDGEAGDDLSNGTFGQTLKTIQAGVTLTRTLRAA